MMQLKKPLNIAVYSDVHLGHRRVSTEDTARAIIDDIHEDEKQMGPLDMIAIPGDLFDRHLPLHHPDSHISLWFLTTLARYCKEKKTHLRILEGTPSHDWKQSRLIDAVKESLNAHDYVRYVEDLYIEDIEELGISVLYLPDEWAGGPEEAWMQVIELMAKEGRDYVDVIMMHGMFEYQMPPGVKAPYHDLERYQSITRLHIYCGHVHKHSTREKLTVPGSYNRLAHNEEHRKGHIRTHISQEALVSNTFVENKRAQVFKSIDVSQDVSLSDFHSIMEEWVNTVPEGSYLRVMCKRADATVFSERELSASYPMYRWQVEYTDKVRHQMATLSNDTGPYQATPITSKTIVDMTKTLAKELGHDEETIQGVVEVLKGYVVT